jgi:hypothetical protein
MRTASMIVLLMAGIGLSACGRKESDQRDSAAREAGRAAYRLSEQTKKAAKELRRDVRQAGKEARQGWDQAKHEDASRHGK